MIIVDSYKENIRTFGEANPGDCFVHEGEYFMKTEGSDSNAVNLRTGKVVWCDDTLKVMAIRMKAEVY